MTINWINTTGFYGQQCKYNAKTRMGKTNFNPAQSVNLRWDSSSDYRLHHNSSQVQVGIESGSRQDRLFLNFSWQSRTLANLWYLSDHVYSRNKRRHRHFPSNRNAAKFLRLDASVVSLAKHFQDGHSNSRRLLVFPGFPGVAETLTEK